MLPDERRAADLKFLSLCESAINIGDVLLSLAVDPALPPNVRLTCGLAVEPMLTTTGWTEGNRFSDKELLSQSLLACVSSGFQNESKALSGTLLRCLAQIITLEYYSERWNALLTTLAADALAVGGSGLELLLMLSTSSRKCPALWLLLAHDVAELWINRLRCDDSGKADALQFISNLLRHRCKPSEEHEYHFAEQCFILQGGMLDYLVTLLESQVSLGSCVTPSMDWPKYFKESSVMLVICSRLAHSPSLASCGLESSIYFLINAKTSYFNPGNPTVAEQVISVVESSLECIQSVLMPFTEHCASRYHELMNAVMPFLIRLPDMGEDSEDELIQLVVEDEAVPLGCGGDDICSLAGAIIELFLEGHPERCGETVQCLLSLISELSSRPSNAAMAMSLLYTGLFHISRVYNAGSKCLASDVNQSQPHFFASLCSILACHLSQEYDTSHLLYSMSQCFRYCSDESLLAEYFSFLSSVRQQMPSTSSQAYGMLLHAVAVVLPDINTSLALQVVDGWWMHCLQAASTAPSPTFYLLSDAINIFVRIHSDLTVAIFESGYLMMILEKYCLYSSTRVLPSRLTTLLELLLDHTTGSLCAAVQPAVEQLSVFCLRGDIQSQLLLRQFTSLSSTIAAKAAQGSTSCCQSCGLKVLREFLPVLAAYGSDRYPFDDSTTRALAVCFGSSVLVAADALKDSLGSIRSATCCLLLSPPTGGGRHAATLVSAICASIALQGIAAPAALDMDITPLLRSALSGDVVEERCGVNYLGLSMLLSAIAVRSPSVFFDVFSLMPSADRKNDGGWRTAIGLWASVALFADDFSWGYILCGWLSIINYMVSLAVQQRAVFYQAHRGMTVYMFPSIFTKTTPRHCSEMSFLDAIIAGLLLSTRQPRGSSVSGFKKDLNPLLSVEQAVLRVSEGRTSVEQLGAAPLLQIGRKESCRVVLEHLSSAGYADAVCRVSQLFA